MTGIKKAIEKKPKQLMIDECKQHKWVGIHWNAKPGESSEAYEKRRDAYEAKLNKRNGWLKGYHEYLADWRTQEPPNVLPSPNLMKKWMNIIMKYGRMYDFESTWRDYELFVEELEFLKMFASNPKLDEVFCDFIKETHPHVYKVRFYYFAYDSRLRVTIYESKENN
jgi:hypothetical protein